LEVIAISGNDPEAFPEDGPQHMGWSCPVFVDTLSFVQEVFTMGKTRPSYPPEFRQQMVELVRVGRTPEELAREFEPSAQAIRNWIRQADRDQGRRQDGPSSEELEELRRLRREIRCLREEREILAKAAVWFARETDAIPRKSSRS
jgi:transposase